MDLIFHAPYVLRGALLLLAAGLPLAAWTAARRREWGQIRWLALLFAGLALAVGGGIALTDTMPDAHTAEVALASGVALIAAGGTAVWRAACELWTGSERQAQKALHIEQSSEGCADTAGAWPPPPNKPAG